MKKILLLSIGILSCLLSAKAQKSVDEQIRKLIISTVTINNYYVDSVDTEKLVEDAIRGMIEKLDPHSAYSTAEQTKRLNEPLQGSFDGIGVQFNILDDTLMVIQTVTGGPAEKAGVMAGDRIISVGDTAIAGVKMPQEEIMKRLRGPRGTKAHLGIMRDGIGETIYIDVIRDKIPLNSVDAAFMVTPHTGLIRFSNFAATTHEEVVEAIKKLKAQGMKNLILDVTQNGGGFLQAAAEIASELLPKDDLIVYTKGRAIQPQSFLSRGGSAFQDGKVIVLVDEYSASAAEILAGAVQDQDRGLVVGRRTFGKGLVQRPVDLPDGSMIRLTIAKYYTPSGRCIQKPYEKGKQQEYRMDVINRFNHGELTNADSIHFPDSLRFQTLKKGRTVYGGGGIMPDYFVPLDTTKNTSLYRQIVAKRILIDANLRYLAKHRNELKQKFPTFEDFRRKYEVPRELIDNILAEAKKALKDKYPKDEDKKTTELLKRMLRALAARDLWDMNEYFAIIYEDDDIVNKAIQLMEEQ
ncbi:MAG: PDZ domain-containing protein [Bacteroidaceae bacterium]|nr:PDZ domain-containing protein [Bacteroidaceae bacterium]